MSIRLLGKLLVHIVLLTLPLTPRSIAAIQGNNIPIEQNNTTLEDNGTSTINLRKQFDQNNEVEGVIDNSTPIVTPLNTIEIDKIKDNLEEEIRRNIITNLSAESMRQFHPPTKSILEQTETISPETNIAQPTNNETGLDEKPGGSVVVNPSAKISPEKSESFNIFIASCTLILSIAATSYLIYNTASLFSKGFYSTKFYRGGGTLMAFMALQGSFLGGFLGWTLWHNIYASISSAGPVMCLFASAIITGPRGATLGGFGGYTLGLVFGNFTFSGMSFMIFAPLFTAFCGSVLGNFPIFPNLKINQRYMRKLIIERGETQTENIS